MSTIDIYEQLKKKREEFRKEMMSLGSKIVIDHVQSLFDKYPQVKSVSWSQYTPYFNDGEPCEFRAEWPSFTLKESFEKMIQRENLDPKDPGSYIYVLEREYDDSYKDGLGDEIREGAEFQAIKSMVSDEELMYSVFGDHIMVLVLKNDDGSISVHTEEYEDHD